MSYTTCKWGIILVSQLMMISDFIGHFRKILLTFLSNQNAEENF